MILLVKANYSLPITTRYNELTTVRELTTTTTKTHNWSANGPKKIDAMDLDELL
jgi:hypothetical protein